MTKFVSKIWKLAALVWLFCILAALPVAVRAGFWGVITSPVSAFYINYANVRLLFSDEVKPPERSKPMTYSSFAKKWVEKPYVFFNSSRSALLFQKNGLHLSLVPSDKSYYFFTQGHVCFRKKFFGTNMYCEKMWETNNGRTASRCRVLTKNPYCRKIKHYSIEMEGN